MEFKEGYQKYSYKGQPLHIYKQSGKEKIGLVSFPLGVTKDITEFQNVTVRGKKLKVKAVLNANRFDMAGKTYNYLGRMQSFTEDAATPGLGESNFVGYKGTTDKPYIDLVITNDMEVKAGDMNSWDWRKLDIILGTSPDGVQVQDGKDVSIYAPVAGWSKITTANTQSLLLQASDGKFVLVAVSGKLSPIQCRDYFKSYNIIHQSCYDSGGSTQMIVDGVKKVYTGRKLPVCFIIYEEIEDEPSVPVDPATPVEPPVIEEPTDPVVTTRMIKCTHGTLHNGADYPTRAALTSDWDRNNYFVHVGDVLKFDDVQPIQGRPDCFFQIAGGGRPDLIGRWVAYDKNYFD